MPETSVLPQRTCRASNTTAAVVPMFFPHLDGCALGEPASAHPSLRCQATTAGTLPQYHQGKRPGHTGLHSFRPGGPLLKCQEFVDDWIGLLESIDIRRHMTVTAASVTSALPKCKACCRDLGSEVPGTMASTSRGPMGC